MLFLSWEWDFFIAKKVTMLQKSPCFLGSKSQLGPPKEWSNRLDNHGTLGPFLDRRRFVRVSFFGSRKEAPCPRHAAIPPEVRCLGYVFGIQIPNLRRWLRVSRRHFLFHIKKTSWPLMHWVTFRKLVHSSQKSIVPIQPTYFCVISLEAHFFEAGCFCYQRFLPLSNFLRSQENAVNVLIVGGGCSFR